MTAVQQFADHAQAAARELTELLPVKVQESVADMMECGCTLSISACSRSDGSPEILLELIGPNGARQRLASLPGQFARIN